MKRALDVSSTGIAGTIHGAPTGQWRCRGQSRGNGPGWIADRFGSAGVAQSSLQTAMTAPAITYALDEHNIIDIRPTLTPWRFSAEGDCALRARGLGAASITRQITRVWLWRASASFGLQAETIRLGLPWRLKTCYLYCPVLRLVPRADPLFESGKRIERRLRARFSCDDRGRR
jgi:hypothetical protein